jgi:hypothetical protein
MFKGLAGEVVGALAPRTEADPRALLAELLAFFGVAVGRSPHCVADAARHGANEYLLVCGRTARARKGTAHAQVAAVFERVNPRVTTRSGLSTGEGLTAALADTAALLIVEPEFARTLDVAQRPGATLSALLRELWDVGVMTRAKPIDVNHAHLVIVGHVTEDELARALVTVEVLNGFANRFLFLCVDRERVLPDAARLGDDAYRRLGSSLARAIAQARRRTRLERTAAARDLWDRMYRTIARHEPFGAYGAVSARYEAHLLRLSLLYALLDGAPAIDVEHLESAWDLLCVADDSARRLFSSETGDRTADKLLDGLRALRQRGRPAELTGTEQRNLFARHASKETLTRARVTLERAGVAFTSQRATGGRPIDLLVLCDPSAECDGRTEDSSLRSLWAQSNRGERYRPHLDPRRPQPPSLEDAAAALATVSDEHGAHGSAEE